MRFGKTPVPILFIYVYVGYIGEDCSVNSTSLPNVMALTNNGLCDTSERECTSVLLNVENLFYTEALSCKVEVDNSVFSPPPRELCD